MYSNIPKLKWAMSIRLKPNSNQCFSQFVEDVVEGAVAVRGAGDAAALLPPRPGGGRAQAAQAQEVIPGRE